MSKESACRSSEVSSGLRISSIPFSEIPGQSKLFLDYQHDPVPLSPFYPSAIAEVSDLKSRADEVLANHRTDRDALADALHEINSFADPGHPTFANIELLRKPDTVAILTGQQAGLFSGPLYTVYKAISAIALAEKLTREGVSAVPIFWVATEDHDFAEIAEATILDSAGAPAQITYNGKVARKNSSVGSIALDDSIAADVGKLFGALPNTEFSLEVEAAIASTWKPGSTIGGAFIAHLAKLLGRYGLSFVDPLNSKLKELAAPLYRSAVEKSDEIVSRLVERAAELADSGYHSQVLVEADYFPLFWHTSDGERSAIRRVGDSFVSKSDRREFSLDELAEIASRTPERLSPGVMLRPAVQDYLFPTLCYFGGGAEIAYFAQNSVVYEILGRPMTPILHRQSFTVVESRIARNLDSLGIDFCDVFSGKDSLTEKIVEQTISPETGRLFAEVEERINGELNKLDQQLSLADPTLANNLATRRRKIVYHIAALRKKALNSELRRHVTAEGRLNSVFESLYTAGALQERSINVTTFLNKYGDNFIDWLIASVDLDDRGHRVIYL